jgi:ABC-2 type transport system permease protein
MSVPVSEFQIVFSKFVSSLLFYVYILLPTIVYALLLSGKASIDVGEIISSYIGLILFASAIFSIGLFISSLCSNQISAGIITLAVIMFIIMLGIFQAHYIKNETIAGFLSYINVLDNIKPFFRGILDSRSVIFFLSVVVFFIFLSVRIMESKRWM